MTSRAGAKPATPTCPRRDDINADGNDTFADTDTSTGTDAVGLSNGRAASESPPAALRTLSAQDVLTELDTRRRAFAARYPGDSPERGRIQAARITLGRENADQHARNVEAAAAELGLDGVVEVLEHVWGRVAEGGISPRLAACIFHGGGGGFSGALQELTELRAAARRAQARERARQRQRGATLALARTDDQAPHEHDTDALEVPPWARVPA